VTIFCQVVVVFDLSSLKLIKLDVFVAVLAPLISGLFDVGL